MDTKAQVSQRKTAQSTSVDHLSDAEFMFLLLADYSAEFRKQIDSTLDTDGFCRFALRVAIDNNSEALLELLRKKFGFPRLDDIEPLCYALAQAKSEPATVSWLINGERDFNRSLYPHHRSLVNREKNTDIFALVASPKVREMLEDFERQMQC